MHISRGTRMVLFSMVIIIGGLFSAAALTARDWRSAPRESAGIAPLPVEEPRAVVQVYAARAINWRGWFAVHSWIATKEKNADAYTTYHVMGWQLWRTGTALRIEEDIPDRQWFGAMPTLVADLRGPEAESAIANIKAAAASYPYGGAYRAWPGPNSNTFISHIIRNTPELAVELPPHAIGKDWMTNDGIFARSESGTGYQFSLLGVLGATVGKAEGVEINVLGLNFGVDLLRPALKLPIVGRIGMADAPPAL